MVSNFFDISSMKSEKSSSSSSLSKKNKKCNGSDKPKQPQRGLGVAQLEQIRLRNQMACGFNPPSNIQEDIMRVQGVGPYEFVPQSSTSFVDYSQSSSLSTSSTYDRRYHHHHNFMMTFGEENLRYQDSEPRTTSLRWNPNRADVSDNSTFRRLSMPSQQLATYYEDPRHHKTNSMCPSSQNSQSSDYEEVDLELRLSII